MKIRIEKNAIMIGQHRYTFMTGGLFLLLILGVLILVVNLLFGIKEETLTPTIPVSTVTPVSTPTPVNTSTSIRTATPVSTVTPRKTETPATALPTETRTPAAEPTLTITPAKLPGPTSTPVAMVDILSKIEYYTVVSGDSWWRISEEQLGNGLLYPTIQAYNDMLSCTSLQPNMQLKLPILKEEAYDKTD